MRLLKLNPSEFLNARAVRDSEWCLSITQWDLPALLGADPLLVTPMDVKREKLMRQSSPRLISAHHSSLVVRSSLMQAGYRRVACIAHQSPKHRGVAVYGVLKVPEPNRSFGVFVPVYAPRRPGHPDAVAVGWLPPGGGNEDNARVPKWALAMAHYSATLMDASWCGIAAISAYNYVTQYVVQVDRGYGQRLIDQARSWLSEQVGNPDTPATSFDPGSPAVALESSAIPVTPLLQARLKRLAEMDREIQEMVQARLDAADDVYSAMGTATRIVSPLTGQVLAEIVRPPDRWVPISSHPTESTVTKLGNLCRREPQSMALQVHV